MCDLLLENEDLVANGPNLADNAGGDELGEVDEANVVEETKLELLELETGQIEAVENTELVDLEEGVQLLELKKGSEVKVLLLEEALELKDVQVVDVGEVAKEADLEGVDVEQIVEVDLLEALEAIEGVDVKGEGAGFDLGGDGSRSGSGSRGGGSEGGQGRNEDGEDLHFD